MVDMVDVPSDMDDFIYCFEGGIKRCDPIKSEHVNMCGSRFHDFLNIEIVKRLGSNYQPRLQL